MAEGGPGIHEKRSGMGDWREDPRSAERQAEKEKSIKKLFSSAQWNYPVYRCIGDIVKYNKFRMDLRHSQQKKLCYLCYCDMVSEFMEHLADLGYRAVPETIATAVLKVLPTHTNIVKSIPLALDADALISQKDAVYILGSYSLTCFEFLLSRFTIELKESCLDFVEKQLKELAETKPVIANLEKKISEFAKEQSNKFNEQKVESVERLERSSTNKYLCGIKRAVLLPFIMSEEIDPKTMPPAPKDPTSWEEHFRNVCEERLKLVVAKEKDQWDADLSETHTYLKPKMNHQFYRLKAILDIPGVDLGNRTPNPFTKYMAKFSVEISEKLRMSDNVEEITRQVSERFKLN